MTKVIKGDLVMTEDMAFDDDLKVEGNIYGKDGEKYSLNCWNLNCLDLNCWDLNCWNLKCRNLNCWNLKCRNLNCWNLKCRNLNCLDLKCWDLNCWNLKCRNLNCWDLNCLDLNCWDLNCLDLNFYAVAIAYKSFKCKRWNARRDNYVIKCLDGEIEIKDDKQLLDRGISPVF